MSHIQNKLLIDGHIDKDMLEFMMTSAKLSLKILNENTDISYIDTIKLYEAVITNLRNKLVQKFDEPFKIDVI